MLSRLVPLLARFLPTARSAAGAVIPTGERVGPDFPEWRADALGVAATPAPGLLQRPDVLGLPPAIADFYRHSAAYRIVLQPHFPWLSRRLLPWFRRTFADPWGQLQFPLAPDAALSDRFVEVAQERWWVRAGAEGTMYCGRFDTIELDGVHYLRVSIPTPPFTLIAVFSPQRLHRMVRFGQPKAPTGLYLAPRNGALRRVPFFREEITLAEATTGLVVRHCFRLAGFDLATLLYLVERR